MPARLNAMAMPNAKPSRATAANEAQPLTIVVDDKRRVSGLLQVPARAHACYVLAHGAGAGMTHPFLAAVASELAERGLATLRYQFPYMEQRAKRPDPPALAQATVRAAVAEAAQRLAGLPLIAGGKSFGGRMTSQAQSIEPLPGVSGLVFFGFPLHPAGKPGIERAAHLTRVMIPMLFLQGTKDTLAELDLLRGVVSGLGERAGLELAEDADHSFHAPARTGRKDAEVLAALLDVAATWMVTMGAETARS